MRLYVNQNEIADLKRALINEVNRTTDRETVLKLGSLYERVELCEKLQKNMNKSKGGS